MGLTDTDDACAAIQNGDPVHVIFPDQSSAEISARGNGTMVIPGSVALIDGAPHPDEAAILIDFLLSSTVEDMLIESGWAHIPLRENSAKPECYDFDFIDTMAYNYDDVYNAFDESTEKLREIYIR